MGMTACFAPVNAETLLELKNHPDQIEDYLYPNDGADEPPGYMDIDKAWHGIHFMLSQIGQQQTALALAVLGGEEVGDDVGYGPARFLTAQQVKAVATSLSELDESHFCEQFLPEAMEAAEIYPTGIWVRDGDEALEYLLENYRQMVFFYQQTAENGDGAVLWLC